jgi:hypothetical protein
VRLPAVSSRVIRHFLPLLVFTIISPISCIEPFKELRYFYKGQQPLYGSQPEIGKVDNEENRW